MTRKCTICNTTKGLKNCWVEEDENGKWNENKSVCGKCFFDEEFENEQDIVTQENWNEYNYRWEKKK